jgi:hypothetical protein
VNEFDFVRGVFCCEILVIFRHSVYGLVSLHQHC